MSRSAVQRFERIPVEFVLQDGDVAEGDAGTQFVLQPVEVDEQLVELFFVGVELEEVVGGLRFPGVVGGFEGIGGLLDERVLGEVPGGFAGVNRV